MGKYQLVRTMASLTVILAFLLAVAAVNVEGFTECGKRYFNGYSAANSDAQGYIVGGSNAVRGSLPWQVSIQKMVPFLWWNNHQQEMDSNGCSLLHERQLWR